MPRGSERRRRLRRGSCAHCPQQIRPLSGSDSFAASSFGGSRLIVACLALALAAVPAPVDTSSFVLQRAGGFTRLSQDASRPVEPAGLAFDSFGRLYVS